LGFAAQLSVNPDIGWFRALFPGELSWGVPGVAGIVVKIHGPAQLLVPPAFVALTSQ
jgi:hypothetical protein